MQKFEIIRKRLAINFVMEVEFIIIIYIIEEFFKTEIFNTIFKKSDRLRQDKLIIQDQVL